MSDSQQVPDGEENPVFSYELPDVYKTWAEFKAELDAQGFSTEHEVVTLTVPTKLFGGHLLGLAFDNKPVDLLRKYTYESKYILDQVAAEAARATAHNNDEHSED